MRDTRTSDAAMSWETAKALGLTAASAERRSIQLPTPTLDQIEFIQRQQVGLGQYDPNYLVQGRSPEDIARTVKGGC